MVLAEDPSDFNEVAKKFTEQFLDWVKRHEQEHHNGEFCADERANILAYIAHSIGHSQGIFLRMLVVLNEYNLACPHRAEDTTFHERSH